jgi:hypothetical protein
MATQIILGKGAVLSYATTSSGTYNLVPQAVSVDGVELSKEMIDQVILSSTIKPKRPALPEAPTLSFTVFFDPTDTVHTALITAWAAGTQLWFKVVLLNPDDGTTKSTMAFPAYIESFKESGIEVSSNVQGVFSLVLTAIPTFT